jgi:glutamate N-acetyltransferase/amino-acid N-acetyltransferase
LVNSGQANAQTGDEGFEDAKLSAQKTAEVLGLDINQIALCSTGVIGQRLNLPPMLEAIPKLAGKLSADGFDDFARAIMTTDTVPKTASAEVRFESGPPASIWGAAKGSGMIAPNMATMLGFILTDAAFKPSHLLRILKRNANFTFNRITVDGDTSTNDSLIIIASGAANRPPITEGNPDAIAFDDALFKVMDSLSWDLVKDGEGATKALEIVVKNAKTISQAQKAARTVAESLLVKTALFGGDANWGRILAALGRSGAEFDPYQVNLDIGEVPWVRYGRDNGREKEATEAMKCEEQTLTIDLNNGHIGWTMLTCDLSYKYVEINGSYRS